MYYSLHQTSWPLGNQLTCPVVNVYSANFSVRSITYLEKKLLSIKSLLLLLFWFWSANVITYQSFENFINGCTLMTLQKIQLKIYLNFGCILYMEHHFFLHFTPNFGGAYYTKLHITHKPVHAVPTYSMFYYFSMQCPIRISDRLLLVIAASLWERQQCVISNWSFQ